jgi:hypothetical protein
VPFTREFTGGEELASTQYVEVGVPVGGPYAPFDLKRRDATRNAATPPPTPPEPPESRVKTIQSIGESEKIRGKGECNEPGRLATEPVSDTGGGDGGAVDATGDTKPVVTVIGPDTEELWVLLGSLHAGTSTTTAKSKDAVRSHLKSDKSGVHQESFAVPARMPKSQAKIVMVLYPCKSGLSWLRYGCFLQVKRSPGFAVPCVHLAVLAALPAVWGWI